MVSASYFKGANYMSADVWLEWWADALRMDAELDFKGNTPNIKAIKPTDDLAKSVKEVFKYAVKSVGSEDEEIDDDWIKTFLELDRQLKGTKAQALGGFIRKGFKDQGDITAEEMIGGDEIPDEETIAYWLYQWNALRRWYARSRVLDKEEVQFLEMKGEEKKKRKGALSKPLPDEIRASEEIKFEWEMNRAGASLNAEAMKKPKKSKKGREQNR
jgi:hypothetical protein